MRGSTRYLPGFLSLVSLLLPILAGWGTEAGGYEPPQVRPDHPAEPPQVRPDNRVRIPAVKKTKAVSVTVNVPKGWHVHRCEHGHAPVEWAHGDLRGNVAAHTCPVCGMVHWNPVRYGPTTIRKTVMVPENGSLPPPTKVVQSATKAAPVTQGSSGWHYPTSVQTLNCPPGRH